jgi:hypothetical protein
MQKQTKIILFSGLGAVVVTAGLLLSSSAASAQSDHDQPFTGLVEAVAKKFNLDQSQVQAVFDEYHTQQRQQMMEKMQDREAERLAKLVADGKITQAQQQAILAKLAELKTEFSSENVQDLTP